MRLGILPEQGGGIARLRRGGQDTRFIEQYLRRYVAQFDEVHYFSYLRETLDTPVAPNFHLHPNPGLHRWLYAFAMPLLQARAFRRCSVMRIMQATGAIPAFLARALFGVPFVATYGYHYSTELRAQGRRLRAWLFDRRAAWALRTADGIIVTTAALAEYVGRFAPAERIALIPNSVETDRFAPASADASAGKPADQLRPPRARRRLIAVGNLTANKNHRLILQAVALTGRDDIDVVIFGKGPEEASLRALAAEKNVSLELPGTVPNDALPDQLRQADLYLITSLSEGHPKSLLEAMSVALPCVGTNAPGIRDVLSDGQTGWLCAPEPAALAKAVNAALSNLELARGVGRRARQFILDHHSAAVIMAREIDFLKSVSRHKNTPRDLPLSSRGATLI